MPIRKNTDNFDASALIFYLPCDDFHILFYTFAAHELQVLKIETLC